MKHGWLKSSKNINKTSCLYSIMQLLFELFRISHKSFWSPKLIESESKSDFGPGVASRSWVRSPKSSESDSAFLNVIHCEPSRLWACSVNKVMSDHYYMYLVLYIAAVAARGQSEERIRYMTQWYCLSGQKKHYPQVYRWSVADTP